MKHLKIVTTFALAILFVACISTDKKSPTKIARSWELEEKEERYVTSLAIVSKTPTCLENEVRIRSCSGVRLDNAKILSAYHCLTDSATEYSEKIDRPVVGYYAWLNTEAINDYEKEDWQDCISMQTLHDQYIGTKLLPISKAFVPKEDALVVSKNYNGIPVNDAMILELAQAPDTELFAVAKIDTNQKNTDGAPFGFTSFVYGTGFSSCANVDPYYNESGEYIGKGQSMNYGGAEGSLNVGKGIFILQQATDLYGSFEEQEDPVKNEFKILEKNTLFLSAMPAPLWSQAHICPGDSGAGVFVESSEGVLGVIGNVSMVLPMLLGDDGASAQFVTFSRADSDYFCSMTKLADIANPNCTDNILDPHNYAKTINPNDLLKLPDNIKALLHDY